MVFERPGLVHFKLPDKIRSELVILKLDRDNKKGETPFLMLIALVEYALKCLANDFSNIWHVPFVGKIDGMSARIVVCERLDFEIVDDIQEISDDGAMLDDRIGEDDGISLSIVLGEREHRT